MDAPGHARAAINLVTSLDDLVDTNRILYWKTYFISNSLSCMHALEYAQEATNLVTLLDVHVGIIRGTLA